MQTDATTTALGRTGSEEPAGTTISYLARHRHAEVPIGPRPVTVVHRGSAFLGLFMLVFGAVWGGFPLFGLLSHGAPDLSQPVNWLFLIFPVVGLGIVLYGLHRLVWRKTIALDDLFATVAERGLFGAKTWQEPLTAYRGVLRRSRQVSTKHSSYTLHLVDLHHADESRCLNLYASRRRDGWRTKWEAYARWLDLPALEAGEDGPVVRDVDALDASIGDLIKEGEVAFDPSALHRRSDDLIVTEDAQGLVVTRARPQVTLFGLLLLIAVPGVMIYFGFYYEGGGIDAAGRLGLGIMGSIFAAVALAGIIWDRIARRRLRVTSEHVRVSTVGPWGETRGRSLAIAEIESVKVAAQHKNGRTGVLIEGDRGLLAFGASLPAPALDHVRSLILARIAERTRRR